MLSISLGAHGAIFSSVPSRPPDVPRTPGMRQTETQPAVSRHPAAGMPDCPVDIRPLDVLAQRQHLEVARAALKPISGPTEASYLRPSVTDPIHRYYFGHPLRNSVKPDPPILTRPAPGGCDTPGVDTLQPL
jgi:hypothetical protein